MPARELRPGWVLSLLRGAVPTQPAQALRLPLTASQRPTLDLGAASTTQAWHNGASSKVALVTDPWVP